MERRHCLHFPLGRLKNKILSLLKPFRSLGIKSSKEAYATAGSEERKESVMCLQELSLIATLLT